MRYPLPEPSDPAGLAALRQAISDSPETVALCRAQVFTRVFRATVGAPWCVRKATAFREYLNTVPLYLREHDRLAGSISETPGAMPLIVELGIAENNIYVRETPGAGGYLEDQVPSDIDAYWADRNLWGRLRAYYRTVEGRDAPRGRAADYKLISHQGHLCPSYAELLRVGLGGLLTQVRERLAGEVEPRRREWLKAAELSLTGVSEWAARYGTELSGEVAETCAAVALDPPATFRQAMQLIWLCQQAIHVEGHGYSNTPDRLDQLLYPYYLADRAAGRLTDAEALTLCANFILKQRDNTFWGPRHHLTQGLVVAGSTPDGADQTNELSWLFLEAADRMCVPEPLVWLRWHPALDPDFFDFCLEKLAGRTCFPLIMSDTAVPAMFMALGVEAADAWNYVPVGCNELAIPGRAYYNPGAGVNYLAALEQALTDGRGYTSSEAAEHPTFDSLTTAVGQGLRRQIAHSYQAELPVFWAQVRWGQSPFTSCFFDGCIDGGHDLVEGTKYNLRTCGGTAFANLIDCLAAVRRVVFERREATLGEIVAACRDNFEGHAALRARLLRAPKMGSDDPSLRELIKLVERLRDEPLKEICRHPLDGTPYANGHVVRSSHITGGRHTGATPDGRLAGMPLADSIACSGPHVAAGPTALLQNLLALDPVHSWQSGYNVNLRLAPAMLTRPENRVKVARLLETFFAGGGQEMQVNCVDSATLRAARADPAAHRDLVVRVAGFSAHFIDLDPAIQDELLARLEHSL